MKIEIDFLFKTICLLFLNVASIGYGKEIHISWKILNDSSSKLLSARWHAFNTDGPICAKDDNKSQGVKLQLEYHFRGFYHLMQCDLLNSFHIMKSQRLNNA